MIFHGLLIVNTNKFYVIYFLGSVDRFKIINVGIKYSHHHTSALNFLCIIKS